MADTAVGICGLYVYFPPLVVSVVDKRMQNSVRGRLQVAPFCFAPTVHARVERDACAALHALLQTLRCRR